MTASKFVPAKSFLARLTAAERAAAKTKAKAVIAEEITLRGLREAGDLTQAKIGARLKISQDQVSRLEKRADMLLSTLHKYVAAMGGSVHVLVEMPGRPPVKLADLAAIFGDRQPRRRRGSAKKKPRARAA